MDTLQSLLVYVNSLSPPLSKNLMITNGQMEKDKAAAVVVSVCGVCLGPI